MAQKPKSTLCPAGAVEAYLLHHPGSLHTVNACYITFFHQRSEMMLVLQPSSRRLDGYIGHGHLTGDPLCHLFTVNVVQLCFLLGL